MIINKTTPFPLQRLSILAERGGEYIQTDQLGYITGRLPQLASFGHSSEDIFIKILLGFLTIPRILMQFY